MSAKQTHPPHEPLGKNPLPRKKPLAVMAKLGATLAFTFSTCVFAQQAVDIPAQSLADALKALGQQTGLQIVYNAELIAGKQSPAVQGTLEADEVLGQLLKGTDITFEVKGNSVMLTVPGSSDVIMMSPVKVGGSAVALDGTAEAGYREENISGIGPWGGERSLQETPYSLTVFPEALIENTIAVNFDQLIKMVPTVQSGETYNAYGEVGVIIRGFYSYEPLINGIPVTSSFGLSTEDVEQVEVLSGMSGFLYGAGNVGGRVNYVSKRPTKERLTKITAGNYGGEQYYVHADLGGPIDDDGTFGYRINLVTQPEGDTEVDNQNTEKLLVSGAFDWHATDDLLLQLNLSHRDYTYGGYSGWNTQDFYPVPDTSKTLAPPWAGYNSKTNSINFDVTWDINEVFTLRSSYLARETKTPNSITTQSTKILSLLKLIFGPDANGGVIPSWLVKEENLWDTVATEDMIDQTFTKTTNQKRKDKSGRLFLDAAFNTASIQHNMTFGYTRNKYQDLATGTEINFQKTVYNYDGVVEPNWSALEEKPNISFSETTNSSMIIGDDIKFDDQWSALVGFNYTTIKTDSNSGNYDESALTPSISILYKPVPKLTTYITYIEALEQGTIVGEGYANEGDILEPLTSEQIELGMKYELGETLLTASLFRIEKANNYTDGSFFGPIKPTLTQDGLAVHQGIELTMVGKVSDNLTLSGGLTMMDLAIRKADDPSLEGTTPGFTADKTAKLYAEYTLPAINGLTLTGGVYYTGEKTSGAGAGTDYETKAYTIADLGLRYNMDISNKPTTFRLYINNISDKDYWISPYYLGTPRSIAFSASMEF